MKVLFLGGTGNISTACVAEGVGRGHEVTVLTRGKRPLSVPPSVQALVGDREDEMALSQLASSGRYDTVVDFLAFRPDQVAAAVRAFGGRVGQYVFISSASVYQKPVTNYIVTEETPLANPFWEYARQKIACEDRVRRAHADNGFPATIVRPSYTYGPSWIPSGFGGQDYTVVDRMRRGLPIVCHGDGTALWVMTAASDFAVGLVGLLGHPQALGEAFHITSDEVLTWDVVYRTIGRAASCEPQMVHVPSDVIARLAPERGGSLLGDKSWSAVFDNSKIKRFVPSYRAGVTFAEGMARSLAWYDAEASRRGVNAEMNQLIDRVIAAQGRALTGP